MDPTGDQNTAGEVLENSKTDRCMKDFEEFGSKLPGLGSLGLQWVSTSSHCDAGWSVNVGGLWLSNFSSEGLKMGLEWKVHAFQL